MFCKYEMWNMEMRECFDILIKKPYQPYFFPFAVWGTNDNKLLSPCSFISKTFFFMILLTSNIHLNLREIIQNEMVN